MEHSIDTYQAEYVDEKVAAKIIAMSVSKLQKLRAAGDGPVFSKIGRLVRYSLDDLHAFMRAKRATRRAGDE